MIYAVYLLAIGIIGALFFQVRDWVFGIKAGMTAKDIEKITSALSKQNNVIAADEEKANDSYKKYEDLKKADADSMGSTNGANDGNGSKSRLRSDT